MATQNDQSIKRRFESSYFNEKWYAWQNPDAHHYSGSVYDHYWDIGVNELRDPSPAIDMTQLDRRLGYYTDKTSYHKYILSSSIGRSFGVYRSWEDLKESQFEFHSTLETHCHKVSGSSRNKNLVYVQAGSSSLHSSWYNKNKAKFDLLINQYDGSKCVYSDADHIFSQQGTKFTAIARLFSEYQEIFDMYDYVFFLDDDIYIETDAINTLFDVCAEESLDAAQPSLSSDSHCIWDVFYQKGSNVRLVNGVEIMMPLLSRKALSEFGPEFFQSVSGFGLDMHLAHCLNQFGGKAGVVDRVTAKHLKPIDDKGGAYYEYMRANLINPKAELWSLVTKHDLDVHFFETDTNLSKTSQREDSYAI